MPAPPNLQPIDQFTEAALITGTVPGAVVNLFPELLFRDSCRVQVVVDTRASDHA
jgi:hypothetical protein